MDDVDEVALAQRAAAGDGVAFAALVRATQAEVRRACAALVDASSADDLAQETYIRAHRALPSYRGEAAVRVWLLGIARRVCLEEIRAQARRRRLHRRVAEPARSIDPTAAVDLIDCVRALVPERREAFVLTQLLGFSYDDAAGVCACPVGTIRSRVARARSDLLTMIGAGEPTKVVTTACSSETSRVAT